MKWQHATCFRDFSAQKMFCSVWHAVPASGIFCFAELANRIGQPHPECLEGLMIPGILTS